MSGQGEALPLGSARLLAFQIERSLRGRRRWKAVKKEVFDTLARSHFRRCPLGWLTLASVRHTEAVNCRNPKREPDKPTVIPRNSILFRDRQETTHLGECAGVGVGSGARHHPHRCDVWPSYRRPAAVADTMFLRLPRQKIQQGQ